MKRIIINGANGYLASNFINELLKQDYEVIALVRGKSKLSAEQRMHASLMDANKGEKITNNRLTVYNYSLLKNNFLLSSDQLESIFNKKSDYFHFAASLKYSEKSKEEIFATNIDGVKNSIKIFQKYAVNNSRFFYISTAYSCGKMDSVFEEKFYKNEDISFFRNYYEQSKRYAENIIKYHIDNYGLKAHIIRPSQVVGNKITGVTKTDFGIFDFTKRICNLSNRYPYESLRIKVNPEATQNLIPIDTIVHYLLRTVKIEDLPVIMNFVSKNLIKNRDIINCICSFLPINISPKRQLDKNSMTPLERLIDIGMSFTGKYCDLNILFDTKNLDKIINEGDYEITTNSLQMMIEYFISNHIKRKKNTKN